MSIFKKKSLEEVKQPQEDYCSNLYCTNEAAVYSPLHELLTEEASHKFAKLYCMDCITEERLV
jgi:hypothetical protein